MLRRIWSDYGLNPRQLGRLREEDPELYWFAWWGAVHDLGLEVIEVDQP